MARFSRSHRAVDRRRPDGPAGAFHLEGVGMGQTPRVRRPASCLGGGASSCLVRPLAIAGRFGARHGGGGPPAFGGLFARYGRKNQKDRRRQAPPFPEAWFPSADRKSVV